MTIDSGREVVLATRNPGKLAELSALLAPIGFVVRPISDYGCAEVDETAPTFVENALLKARAAAEASGLAAIADDSGLEVDALAGAPGVRSARYAGEHADDRANVRRLLAALEGVPEAGRTAHFRCLAVYLEHAADPGPTLAEGIWRGRILEVPRGSGGFGYDPVFYVPGEGRSAAELEAEHKNRISHRALAIRALIQGLESR